eukprot:scaffold160985_cov36-Prasinocladus_malaysianus.AAC.2
MDCTGMGHIGSKGKKRTVKQSNGKQRKPLETKKKGEEGKEDTGNEMGCTGRGRKAWKETLRPYQHRNFPPCALLEGQT